MPADMPIVEGRDAIKAQIQAGIDRGLAQVKIKTVAAKSMGDMASMRGVFELMDAEGNSMIKGKWANLLKKVDGEWMIIYDIFNYDAPMPVPPDE